MSEVGNRYQRKEQIEKNSACHSEIIDSVDNELLFLLAVASCRSPINSFTNPYLVYSHARDSIRTLITSAGCDE
jgi:hypothetical protein